MYRWLVFGSLPSTIATREPGTAPSAPAAGCAVAIRGGASVKPVTKSSGMVRIRWTGRITGAWDGRSRRATGPPSGLLLAVTRSTALDAEIGATVLALAFLGVLGADRPFLAVGDGRQPLPGDSVGLEVFHCRLRSPIAEGQVVLGRAALVAVALDEHQRVRVLLQPRRVVGQRVDRIRSERGLVEIEVDRLELRCRHVVFAPRPLCAGLFLRRRDRDRGEPQLWLGRNGLGRHRNPWWHLQRRRLRGLLRAQWRRCLTGQKQADSSAVDLAHHLIAVDCHIRCEDPVVDLVDELDLRPRDRGEPANSAEALLADRPRHRFGRDGPVEDQPPVTGITALRYVHRQALLAYGLEEPGADPRARPVARDVAIRGQPPYHDLRLGGRARNEERNHSQDC